MQFFESKTLINARPTTVWDVLTDTSNLTVWNSGITDLTGDIRHGGKIRIKSARGGGRTLRIRIGLIPGEVMTWTIRGPLGLYKGVRTVSVTPERGITHMKATVSFSGPLHRILSRMLPDTERAMEDYVPAVRHRAEILDRGLS